MVWCIRNFRIYLYSTHFKVITDHSALKLGHFLATTTYNRVKEEYYWKNMLDDIIHAVRQYVVFQRHHKVAAKNHPAQV